MIDKTLSNSRTKITISRTKITVTGTVEYVLLEALTASVRSWNCSAPKGVEELELECALSADLTEELTEEVLSSELVVEISWLFASKKPSVTNSFVCTGLLPPKYLFGMIDSDNATSEEALVGFILPIKSAIILQTAKS